LVAELYFVTSNSNKVAEAQKVLEKFGVKVVQVESAKKVELQLPSLAEIALRAARVAYLELRAPLFVEDSGLFVEALGGFPGPYSSYVYKTIGIRGILKLMEGVGNRRAWFESAVALICPPFEKVFVGRVYGSIATEARGSGGFGFDPIFVPEGETRTLAEMSVEEKNAVSHRGKALSEMGSWLSRTLASMGRACSKQL